MLARVQQNMWISLWVAPCPCRVEPAKLRPCWLFLNQIRFGLLVGVTITISACLPTVATGRQQLFLLSSCFVRFLCCSFLFLWLLYLLPRCLFQLWCSAFRRVLPTSPASRGVLPSPVSSRGTLLLTRSSCMVSRGSSPLRGPAFTTGLGRLPRATPTSRAVLFMYLGVWSISWVAPAPGPQSSSFTCPSIAFSPQCI